MPYATVTVTPVIPKANYAANDVMSLVFEELPLPTRDGKPCVLKSIQVHEINDLHENINVVIVENIDGAAVIGTSGSQASISDENLRTNKLLSCNLITLVDFGSKLAMNNTGGTFYPFERVIHGKGGNNPYYTIIASSAQDHSGGLLSANMYTLTFSFYYDIPN